MCSSKKNNRGSSSRTIQASTCKGRGGRGQGACFVLAKPAAAARLHFLQITCTTTEAKQSRVFASRANCWRALIAAPLIVIDFMCIHIHMHTRTHTKRERGRESQMLAHFNYNNVKWFNTSYDWYLISFHVRLALALITCGQYYYYLLLFNIQYYLRPFALW